MLSDHERRTLKQIQSELAASDPEFERFFAATEGPQALRGLRRMSLIWMIAAIAALLNVLSLAIGLTSGAFLFGTIALGAVVCELWWPPPNSRHRRRRRNQ